MKRRKHQIHPGYAMRFAESSEAGQVYDFYQNSDRRGAVYLRNQDLIEGQVDKGLFITVRNKDEKIIAASTVYPLADGKKIDAIVSEKKHIEKGRVGELGSVLHISRGLLNEDNQRAFGFLLTPLFGLPPLEVFRKTGQSMMRNGREEEVANFDIMVCNVQPRLGNTIRRISSYPLHWYGVNVTSTLREGFDNTTSDPTANTDKVYFRLSVHSLPAIANWVVHSAGRGMILNNDRDRMLIDMSALPIKEYRKIAEHGGELKNLREDASWTEARRVTHFMDPTIIPHYVERRTISREPDIKGNGGPHVTNGDSGAHKAQSDSGLIVTEPVRGRIIVPSSTLGLMPEK